MSESLAADAKAAVKAIRVSLAVSGALSLIAGIVLLVWPVKSIVFVTGFFAAYLVVAGLVYIGLGIFSSKKGGWARVGHIALGLLYIIAGVIAFSNLREAAVTFAIITVALVVEGFGESAYAASWHVRQSADTVEVKCGV